LKNYNLIDLIDLIKIIKRARQNYLYEKYAAELSELETLRKDVEESVGRLSKQMAVTTDPDKKVM
jgi:cysteinyl-tRNA synthetase